MFSVPGRQSFKASFIIVLLTDEEIVVGLCLCFCFVLFSLPSWTDDRCVLAEWQLGEAGVMCLSGLGTTGQPLASVHERADG